MGSTLLFLFSFERSRTWAYSSAWLERTPDKREVGGSSPPRPTRRSRGFGGVAQLGERLPCTQEVIGSIPYTSTSRGEGVRLHAELESACDFKLSHESFVL